MMRVMRPGSPEFQTRERFAKHLGEQPTVRVNAVLNAVVRENAEAI
jgi:hypothetical protein